MDNTFNTLEEKQTANGQSAPALGEKGLTAVR